MAYGFDAQHLVVWLDVLRVGEPARSGVLCRRHANAMVVPIGWMLDDRREPVPRLFPAPEVQADAEPVRRRRGSRSQRAEQLRLDVAPPPSTAALAAGPGPVSMSATGSASDVDAVGSVRDASPGTSAEAEPGELRDGEAGHDLAPWMPQFDQSDDLQGLLNARGRLLSRAFNGRGAAAD